jgi:hypothetical protein
MAQRLDLQQTLTQLLGSKNVYFQPPTNVVLSYPCIVYHREMMDIRHADDKPYKHMKRYLVTVIDRDPDSPIPDKVAQLPRCAYDRFFTADNLNHDVFKLFF